ncbi:hypothetical protein M438DRAFT_343315 [Aureobasidium pullulans EXF-150]|uniref:Uncharacterized protein n=1 Tax=Aureobasidium pullulans EXF-150 TaxID=1043002 RepID=A0A074XN01_AURPU|nr:uncharacterized protein M438DRAFT_343315 [Aureobasidium pullulans EXF-150]KEQ86888.1 hypothetical protein M438DRAFT_343315 [Aureobasidium pullulans EXF-150]THV86862.1 hypothetical protein D6D29_01191 [Aureobasidium pullulans]THX86364.1 hypothetical protein D6D04_01434 [Aureobasidium pullulans]
MFPTLSLVAFAGLTLHLATGSPLPPSSFPSVYNPHPSTTSVNTLVRRQYNEEDFNDLFDYSWPQQIIPAYDAEPNYKQIVSWPGWDLFSGMPGTYTPFNEFIYAWRDSSPITTSGPLQGPPPFAATMGVADADDDDAPTSGHSVTISAAKIQDAMAKLLADPKAKAWMVEGLVAMGDDELMEQVLSSQAV